MSTTKIDKAKLLVRPTLDTKFHIDHKWWERTDHDIQVLLRSLLCQEHQELFKDMEAGALVDSVDPNTGEVMRVPAIQNVLIMHCAQQRDYITRQTPLVNAIIRIFLANQNTPLSARELGERLGKPPATVLRTISTPMVYKGIRPYLED